MQEAVPETSLRLGFDDTRTKVVLRTTENYREDLVQLAARFRTGGQLGQLAAVVDLDDLLAGLNHISTWPHHVGVEWAPDLRDLVVSVLNDAETVKKKRLDAPEASGEVTSDAVPSLLGADWVAELSTFSAA
ncbi:hypothetical protein GCM10020000_43170 [Streptomyces olivoverticillatus]